MITSCKDCCFAHYNPIREIGGNILVGNTQTGCNINRIDKFRKAGYEVIEAYDEEKEFYIIKAVCPFKRTAEWAKDKENPAAAVEQEVQIKYHIILTFDDTVEFMKILDDFLAQTNPPTSVTVICLNEENMPLLTRTMIKRKVKNWHIQAVLPDINFMDAVDIAVNKVKDPIYLVVNESPAKDFSANLRRLIVDDMKPFAAMQGKLGFLSAVAIHKNFGGNNGGRLKDKIIQADMEDLILNLDELNV